MELDAVLLARLQFALTIMFHYLFPPLSIGLGAIMVVMEGMYLKTRDIQYETMARFWTRLFALNFAIGVASGIVMEFQFGTNWATYSRFVGDVFGSALAAEGIFAFFLESGFLAVLVFGWDKVSPRMHFFSTVMVALGSIFSAVWIVVANSWQQTPAGFHIVQQQIGDQLVARAEITDFWAVVFNPSSVERLTHVLLGAFIMGAFFVMSVSAYYILKRRHEVFARRSFTIGLGFGLLASLVMLLSGHSQARSVARTQPPKLAAFEGLYSTTEGPTPMYVFGIPDTPQQRIRYGLAIPGLLSYLVHGDWQTPVAGLDEIPVVDHPPVGLPFYTYHIMVGVGGLMIVLTAVAGILRWRSTLFEKAWLMRIFVVAVVLPVIGNQLGWVAAEVGRQPWIVWGLLRTQDAASRAVKAEEVLASNLMFAVIYVLLTLVWVYVLDSKIKHGPGEPTAGEPDRGGEGFLATAGARVSPAGRSLTSANPAPLQGEGQG
ncbi:MAG TPA: cytochrome ubiquinol oxidase subunit I [Phycisphaerae bacterium]|nr:cytochrome ubiquinol oxidase subunit I [Phycisphaerae bacterium]HNU47062.1 cytochrome ubiquinol oxidase subunit I [Phycisphaerae bacterium]